MGNKQFKTLNQCTDYALKTRPEWVHSRSRQTIINNLKHAQKAWGNCNVSMIDWMAIDKLVNQMKFKGKAPSTINKTLSAVKTALLFCAKRHLIKEFPNCFEGARQHEPQQTPIVFTFDEVDAMVKYARSYEFMGRDDLADIITALAWSGARRGEMLQLKVKDVDLEHGWLYIGRSFQNKCSKVVPVPIMPKFQEILEPRVKDQHKDALVFGDDWETVDELRYWFNKNRTHALPEDKQYSLKQLRHTFCSALLLIDTPIDRVCDIMCHSSVEVTRRYARALGKQKSRDLVNLAKAYHSGELQTMSKVLTDEDKFALQRVSQQIAMDNYAIERSVIDRARFSSSADVATDPQFQPSSMYNNEVLTPAGARNSSADVAELVDAHV